MRDWVGGPWRQIKEPQAREFAYLVDFYLRDLSRGVGRIQQGQVPDGSGGTIPVGQNGTLDDYLYLPGRPASGNTVLGVDSAPSVVIQSGGLTPTINGSIGNAALRLSIGNSPLLEFRPYLFDSTFEVALTNDTGVGIPVNFPSADGTSALRITSTTNRTFLQAGIKNSGGTISNASMTIGGAGATVGQRLGLEMMFPFFSNTGTVTEGGAAVTANTSIIGIGSEDPFGFSGTALGSTRPEGLYVVGRGAASVAPVGIVSSTTNALEVRAGSAGASPNKTLGAIQGALTADGKLALYSSGSLRSRVTTSGVDTITFEDEAGDNLLEVQQLTRWSDSAITTSLKTGVTTANVMITGGGYNQLSRFGLSSTGSIVANTTSNLIDPPTGIWDVRNYGATTIHNITTRGVASQTGRQIRLLSSAGAEIGYWGGLGEMELKPAATTVVPLIVRTPAGSVQNIFEAYLDTINVFQIAGDGVASYGLPPNWWSSGEVGSGHRAFLNVSSQLTQDCEIFVPDFAQLTLVGTSNTQTLTNKTINTSTIGVTTELNSSTISSGVAFQDVTTTTKQVRAILSGCAASTNTSLTFTTQTTGRNYTFTDTSGNVLTDAGTAVDDNGDVVTLDGEVVLVGS